MDTDHPKQSHPQAATLAASLLPVPRFRHFLEPCHPWIATLCVQDFRFPQRTVLVLGREKEGIPADVLAVLHHTVEIPQLGVVRSLNVHVSGAIALYEYTRQGLERQGADGSSA